MSSSSSLPSHSITPVVVFAYNQPDKLRRVLDTLKSQGIEELFVFFAKSCDDKDSEQVEQCKDIVSRIDWARTDLDFIEENNEASILKDKINQVFQRFESAIILQDDYLPMPNFYSFMAQALAHYKSSKRVFSVGGYQPVEYKYLRHLSASVVSSPRFVMHGWATWQDRWQFVYPYLEKCLELFLNPSDVPDIAGDDLPRMVRVPPPRGEMAWDREVALTTLWLNQVHLLPTKGLIRNIGQDKSSLNPGHPTVQNRNVSETSLDKVNWLENVEPAHEYIKRLKEFVVRATSPEKVSFKDKTSDQVKFSLRLARRGAGKIKRAILRAPPKPQPKRFFDQVLLENVGPQINKRALLSYITDRFDIPRNDPRFLQHIVIWHVQEIVRVLNRMGYSVDIIAYDDRSFVPTRAYDLFIGHMGLNFMQVARALPSHVPKLYLGSTNYWDFHNKNELARLAALKERRGIDVPLVCDRFLHYPEDEALSGADGIVSFGNAFTRMTYLNFSPVIVVGSVALADDYFERQKKNYEEGRNHFLFYAGPGNVHKGLDLLLEAFMELNDQHLWVCTTIEEHFESIYRLAMHHRPNIHLVGLIQPRSPTFYDLVNRCNFAILPSCSEGGAQSIVECMNQGLIPVVTRASALDVEDYGILIDPCNIDEIVTVVSTIANYPAAKCQEMSFRARHAAITKYSEAAFSERTRHALESMLPDGQDTQK